MITPSSVEISYSTLTMESICSRVVRFHVQRKEEHKKNMDPQILTSSSDLSVFIEKERRTGQ
ncbi:hypothetical protein M413DRAFT_442803 [Hebeloma cylindrosporum]|uniref:Uncharacterized protein n=1 Tax=Hebeloma cylindrosporum TaxID=76867 RepID=A0A0C3C7I5_HEBCY|nr:hypothetical protein M413DRAFT_442803 [Hebeloma cylindrosporum h7]